MGCHIYTIAIVLYMSFLLDKNPFKLPFKNLNFSDKLLMIMGYVPTYLFFLIRDKLNTNKSHG